MIKSIGEFLSIKDSAFNTVVEKLKKETGLNVTQPLPPYFKLGKISHTDHDARDPYPAWSKCL